MVCSDDPAAPRSAWPRPISTIRIFGVSCPCKLLTLRHARKIRTELVPVFAAIFSSSLTQIVQRWRSINGTLGIARLITDGEKPLAVAPGIVETLIQSSKRERSARLSDRPRRRRQGPPPCRPVRRDIWGIAASRWRWPGPADAGLDRRSGEGLRVARYGGGGTLIARRFSTPGITPYRAAETADSPGWR